MQFILNNSRLLSYLRGWIISSETSKGFESKNLSSTRANTEVQVFCALKHLSDGALARYPVPIIYLGSCTRQLLGIDASGLVGNSSDTLLHTGAVQDTRIKGA